MNTSSSHLLPLVVCTGVFFYIDLNYSTILGIVCWHHS